MEKRHRKLLRRHRLSFQNDLEPEKLLSYLVSASVFDTEDEEKIRNPQLTSTDKVNTFLFILPRKGPTAFSCFVEALENKQPHLAVALREEEEMEKRMIEIKAELVSARCDSAKLRDQLCSTSANYDLERKKEENLQKEMEELKLLLKKILLNIEKEDMKCNELKNSKMQLAEQLELEKKQNLRLKKELENKTEEMEKLKVDFQDFEDMSNREVNNNIEVVNGQYEKILERMQHIADQIVEFQQSERDMQPCSNCIKRESEYEELKQQMEKEISKSNEEKRKVEALTDKYERENMTSKQDHEAQVGKNNRTISRLKKINTKLEDEIESKRLSLEKVKTELKKAEEDDKKSKVKISKLNATMMEHQDIQKQLKEEINRWRMLPGRVFNYKKDFDRNGIIHFLGTSFNTTPFVNPVSQDNCKMHVSRSSCDRGHPKDILDLRQGTASCTNDVEDSWWQVDFGEEHALFATHYTLRHGHDNGLSMIRNWNLEGSHDGRHWKVLRKHENDRGMKGAYPFYTGSWTVEGRVEGMRYFRIIQTGRNSAGRYALYLSGFEIYGVLLDIS